MKPIHPDGQVPKARGPKFLTGFFCFGALIASMAPLSYALDGQVQIHDPSTIVQCNGKYYTFGTGGTALVSEDGWTWSAGTRALRSGMAPDLIHIGDRYYQYISGNPGGQPHGEITMISNKTLDPNSPDFKWEEGGFIAGSDGVEFCNAIDPGLLLDPNTGKLWMTYGSYFGYIRLVELDPKTGKRVDPKGTPYNIAVNCEASCMIYHDGWYYLLATHGSCCAGTNSGYNIRVGRSRKVTGPFLDHTGLDMLMGGGKLFAGSGGRYIGPGHFGLIDEGNGVQKFSLHYEADIERGGASIVDIRPILWQNGWPVAGENCKEGTYEIESVRTGTALELAVEGVQVGGGRGGRGGGAGMGTGAGGGARGTGAGTPAPTGGAPAGGGAPAPAGATAAGGGAPGSAPGAAGGARGVGAGGGMGGGMFGGTGGVIAPQTAADVSTNWLVGTLGVRMANYLCQAQQKWTIAPANAGGYLGSPYFKITIAGTNRALAAGKGGELVSLPAFTGGSEQLWRIEQLADGTWRIMPKAVPTISEPLALSAIGGSTPTLSKFDPASDKQRWFLKMP